MNRPRSALGVLVAVLATTASASQPELERLDGAGSVRIGQKFKDLAGKADWKADEVGDPEFCTYYTGRLLPDGVSMMVEDGRVARFDVYGEAVAAPFGIRIGDAEEIAMKKLPKGVVVSQHHYGDGGDHYLTWRKPRTHLAIRVEAMGGRVGGVYWGSWDSVQYVEGCL